MIGGLSEAALADVYARSDIFVMSSLYEGYGMVLTEAMARGLPIVITTGGAAAETVPDAAAHQGRRPATSMRSAAALQRDHRRCRPAPAIGRRRLGRRADSLPRWEDTAARIAAVIKELAS